MKFFDERIKDIQSNFFNVNVNKIELSFYMKFAFASKWPSNSIIFSVELKYMEIWRRFTQFWSGKWYNWKKIYKYQEFILDENDHSRTFKSVSNIWHLNGLIVGLAFEIQLGVLQCVTYRRYFKFL